MSYHEKSATELLAPLNVDPDRPSRVDIAAAMAGVRRKRRYTFTAAGAAAVALAGGTAFGGALAFDRSQPAPEPLPVCVATELPMGKYSSVQVTAADPTGRYIAGRANPIAGMKSALIVWHDNTIAEIVKRDKLVITDFDTRGVGVGFEINGSRAYVYRNGALTPLKGDRVEARAINEAGVIVGASISNSARRPVRWASATADPEPLPMPAGVTGALAVDLAEDGTIVGRTDDHGGYLWLPDGTHRPIAPPEIGGTPAYGFEPRRLRGGWVYGEASFPDGAVKDQSEARAGDVPFRYQIATGRYERLPVNDGRPAVHVGNRLIPLPGDTNESREYNHVVRTFSADDRAFAGDNHGLTSDDPFHPMSWRCE
ncbi:hypothetical protein [Actinoplanes sp. NPDC049118]|uniref:hypothetical protein n=1 Tax=Actinoplanes sp. NPDC049118 TaxID=3155769 RepID=UPI0033CC3A59